MLGPTPQEITRYYEYHICIHVSHQSGLVGTSSDYCIWICTNLDQCPLTYPVAESLVWYQKMVSQHVNLQSKPGAQGELKNRL